MNAIASFPLRARHWQIFLVLFAIYFAAQVAFLSSFAAADRSPESFGEAGLLSEGMVVLFMFCLLGWFWALGSFLGPIVHPALRMKMAFFRFSIIYPAFYATVFVALFQSINPAVIALILPLHLLAMFCMFYLLFFVSKSLVLAETGKPASFSDYAGPFFLICFFPVGVWIIQPRINRLYAEKRNAESLLQSPQTSP